MRWYGHDTTDPSEAPNKHMPDHFATQWMSRTERIDAEQRWIEPEYVHRKTWEGIKMINSTPEYNNIDDKSFE